MGRSLILGLMPCVACVFGAKVERAVSGSFDLSGVDTVRVEMADSPMTVVACPADDDPCPRTLTFDGVFLAFGGTRREAEKLTERAEIVFDVADGFGVLSVIEDVDFEEQVRLELGEVRLPDDVDLELDTDVGDIDVSGTRANVRAFSGAGDVVVFGADEGVVVRTEVGDVDVHTPGIVDLWTGDGRLHLAQTGGARDVYIAVDRGSIEVDLASDANLDLFIDARGEFDVKTDRINTVGSGSIRRITGNGTIRVVLENGGGSVVVRMIGDLP